MKKTNLFLKLLLISVLGLTHTRLFSDPVQITHMHNSTLGQNIILFGDVHKMTSSTHLQRQATIDMAKQCNAFLIIEDMGPPFEVDLKTNELMTDDFGKIWHEQLVANPLSFDPNQIIQHFRTSPYKFSDECLYCYLDCLTCQALSSGLNAINVECRFAQTASEGYLPVNASAAFKSVINRIATIQQYEDNEILKGYYQKKIEKFEIYLKQYEFFYNKYRNFNIPLYKFVFTDKEISESVYQIIKEREIIRCMSDSNMLREKAENITNRTLSRIRYLAVHTFITRNLLVKPFEFLIEAPILT